MVKIHKTYSLNIEVMTEFEREFPDVNKSRLLEALIIKYLIDYDRESVLPVIMVGSNDVPKEMP